MKQIRTIATLILLTAFTAGCATSNGYPKKPPPCDNFAASFSADDSPCGPKRPINWN